MNISRIADAFNNCSKVVDENGEPLIVYHGSGAERFSIFDTNGKGKTEDTGAYFHSNPNAAWTYAKAKKGRLMPVFLNIKNPYEVHGNKQAWQAIGTPKGDIFIHDNKTDTDITAKNDGAKFKDINDAQRYANMDLKGLLYPGRFKVRADGVNSTDEIVRKVWEEHGSKYDGVIFRDIYDSVGKVDGDNPFGDVFVTPTRENIKSAILNQGTFDVNNPDIYYQAMFTRQAFSDWFKRTSEKIKNLFTSSVEVAEKPDYSYENKESETRWQNAKSIRKQGLRAKAHRFLHKIAENFRGDYANLQDVALLAAKEEFRSLEKRTANAAKEALKTFDKNLGLLNDDEKDLFGRMRFLEDQVWRKGKVKDAKLPFGFTDESLQKEYERFKKLVEKNPNVKEAIEAEEKVNKEISQEFIRLAKELGYKIPDIFNNPHYFRHVVLEYADFQELMNPGKKSNSKK